MIRKLTSNGTRFDAKQSAYLPNVPLGQGYYKAKPGHWLTYKVTFADGSYERQSGVVLGRIAEGECEGHLLVLQLSLEHGSLFERWIDPTDVLFCGEVPRNLFRWLSNSTDDDCKRDAPGLLAHLAYGTLMDSYVNKLARDANGRWVRQSKVLP